MLPIEAPADLSRYPSRRAHSRWLVIKSDFSSGHLITQESRICRLIDSWGWVLQSLGQLLLQPFISINLEKLRLVRHAQWCMSQVRDCYGTRSDSPSSSGDPSRSNICLRLNPINSRIGLIYMLCRISESQSCQSKLVQIDKLLRLLMIPLHAARVPILSRSCQLRLDLLSVELINPWGWRLCLQVSFCKILISNAELAGNRRLVHFSWNGWLRFYFRHFCINLTHRWKVCRYSSTTHGSAHLVTVLFGLHNLCSCRRLTPLVHCFVERATKDVLVRYYLRAGFSTDPSTVLIWWFRPKTVGQSFCIRHCTFSYFYLK